MAKKTNKKIEKFIEISSLAEKGGGEKRITKQKLANKLTVRERIEHLLDENSFSELDKFVRHTNGDFGLDKKRFYGDGVVTGYGHIEGRLVYVFGHDFTVLGGTLSRTNANKIIKVMELALRNGAPLLGLNDSGGARIQEGVDSMAGYADLFYRNVQCSGVIPQISVIMGPCAGGAVYSPALTDFTIMVEETSHMFLTGPEVIKAVIQEDISKEKLGGAYTHNNISGVAHLMAKNDIDTIAMVRKLMSYLPSNNFSSPPKTNFSDDLQRETNRILDIIPEDSTLPYDVKEVITEIFDKNSFFEIQELFAKNIVVGFSRLGGEVVGIVANQPQYLAGALDIDASVKAARFVRFCDAFNIPIITLVDVPGFLPGIDQEYAGIIKHGAKLMYAYSEASVPLITLVTRKAFGGAYDVMASKHLKADINLAYPSAEIAVMGVEGAVRILCKGTDEKDIDKFISDYHTFIATPYIAAERGYIDEIILPKNTRSVLYKSLESNRLKQENQDKKEHGLIPL